MPWVKNVAGSPAFDSMEVRDARDAAGVKTIDKTGTPCATATDKPKCEAAYAAVHPKDHGDVAFVATRGDDVIARNVDRLDTVDACTGKRTRVISSVDANASVNVIRTDALTEGEQKVCDR